MGTFASTACSSLYECWYYDLWSCLNFEEADDIDGNDAHDDGNEESDSSDELVVTAER